MLVLQYYLRLEYPSFTRNSYTANNTLLSTASRLGSYERFIHCPLLINILFHITHHIQKQNNSKPKGRMSPVGHSGMSGDYGAAGRGPQNQFYVRRTLSRNLPLQYRLHNMYPTINPSGSPLLEYPIPIFTIPPYFFTLQY